MTRKRIPISDGPFFGLMAILMGGAFALGIGFAYGVLQGGGGNGGFMVGGIVFAVAALLFGLAAGLGRPLPPPNTVKISAPPIKVPPAPTVPRTSGAWSAPAPTTASLGAMPSMGGLGETLREKMQSAVEAVTLTGKEAKEAVTEAAQTAVEKVEHAAEAVKAAVTPAKPTPLAAAREGGPDDLKRIKGIGPKLEEMLHGLGYYHFDQIAAWGEAEIAWVDSNLEGFNGRATRDDWVGQAKLLARGGETEFSKKVDEGDVY
jgi:predicted flap endonuclease-1-like 5' DNA nuclease